MTSACCHVCIANDQAPHADLPTLGRRLRDAGIATVREVGRFDNTYKIEVPPGTLDFEAEAIASPRTAESFRKSSALSTPADSNAEYSP